jgi:poly(beta-D-mannuronate) C5 epimerase
MRALITFVSLIVSIHLQAAIVEPLLAKDILVDSVQLPDTDVYNRTVLEQKLEQWQSRKGNVRIARIDEFKQETKIFYTQKFAELTQRQRQIPRVIVIENGLVDLNQLLTDAADAIETQSNDALLFNLPIIIADDATLSINQPVNIRLSEQEGAFVLVIGNLLMQNATVTGWRSNSNSPALFNGNQKAFRPFILGYGGSEMYLIDSRFESLGFEAVGAYGISMRAISGKALTETPDALKSHYGKAPTGWILGSQFTDLYFGYYSYAAKDVVIMNNEYANNIVYGIDPHDYTTGLIVAHNKIYGTQKLHGFIGSRHVSNSYIFNNEIFDNPRSGIMLDRQSDNNVIAYNKAYRNGGDGITLYESSNNQVVGNQFYENRQHGMRARNSVNNIFQDNVVVGNTGSGAYFHTRNLSDHSERDIVKDPYQMRVNGTVIGGLIVGNRSAAVYSENAEWLVFSGLRMEQNGTSTQFKGQLAPLESEIFLNLWKSEQAVRVNLDEQ